MTETLLGTSERTCEGTFQGTLRLKPELTCLETHPWLTFVLDLSKAQYPLWLGLGEARSKIEHIAGVPIQPEFAERLHEVFLAKGAQATTAIEGNTLSEEQVLEQVQGRLTVPPSQEYLKQEVKNILDALNLVAKQTVQSHRSAEVRLSPDRIKEFNRLVLRDLPLNDPDIVPGEYRGDRRVVGMYRTPPPGECAPLMELYCDWLNGDDFHTVSGDLDPVSIAILKAVIAHIYFVWIHPFGDGNGRAARLIEFQILLEAGVPQPAAHLLSNHYNQTRAEYYRQLSAASVSGGNIVPFLTYAVGGLVDQLKGQIAWIREQQMKVTWVNYVHEQFANDSTTTAVRRRKLVLALTERDKPMPRGSLRKLTPQLTELYVGKTVKTLARDLNVLLDDLLIVRERGGYRAHREIVAGLLPTRRRGQGTQIS